MARQARQLSSTGIYHVILRGINRQNIFEDDEDKSKFIDILIKYKKICHYSIYACCLMDNHIHLVIKEGPEPLHSIMKRIGVSFVYWFNWKHRRSGHLFQDRFISSAVEDDSYLLEVIRYIHQNPLNAGLVTDLESFVWSSFSEYLGTPVIADTNFVLQMFSDDIDNAKILFKEFSYNNGSILVDVGEHARLTDEEATILIMLTLDGLSISDLQHADKITRDSILRKLKDTKGLSIRQIARILGLSFNIVTKA